MKIELRNIKILASLSEETPAYTGTLFVDGKKIGDVSNHGHGGCDEYHGDEAAYTAAARFIHAQEKDDEPVNDYWKDKPDALARLSFEGWCHTKAFESLEVKNFASKLSRSIMYTRPNEKNIFAVTFPKGKDKATILAAYKAKYPTYTFLNGMPTAEAFTVYMANVAQR